MTAPVELPPRLSAIASRVVPGEPLADVCCDHAKLAAHLVETGRVPRAIAADVESAPLRAAARLLDAHDLGDRVELREGDGLSVLAPGEVGTVVLAGIGASLAGRLLREGAERLRGVARVIVQANHGFPKLGELRAELDGLGLGLVDECLARERGRPYVILVAARGSGARLQSVADRELGPILRRGEDPLWPVWIERERRRVARAIAGMQRGRADPDTLASYQRYVELLDAGG